MKQEHQEQFIKASYHSKSIRSFIGSKNYEESRRFYCELGFEKVEIGEKMTLFKVNENLAFYLQDYYQKKWINNSMIFLEVEDVELCERDVRARDLEKRYKNVRFTEIKNLEWGREFFMHDPSGVLWHFGEFK